MLPVRQVAKTLEYSPAGEDAPSWLVSDWQGVKADFSLEEFEIDLWHSSLAGQGRPWLVVRRIFGVAPLWGDGVTPDDMEQWSWKDLSKRLGVPEAALRQDLHNAVEFWKKCKMAKSVNHHMEAQAAAHENAGPESGHHPDEDGLPDFQIHKSLTDEQINTILTPFRFHTIRSESDRLYVANRILELHKLLADKYRRESVRQLIVMELSMANYEATIHILKMRLDMIQRKAQLDTKDSAEIQNISKSLENAEKALTALSTTYQKQADEIGGDEMEAGEARRVAIGTISHLMEAHRMYYESGDRDLIDGMFTAEEVVWLSQPLSMRPAQYRPDVVLRMREAMMPENLWGKDYKPTTIQREACRRMLKLVQAMSDEIDAPEIQGIDDVSADSSSPDDSDDSTAINDSPSEESDAALQAALSPVLSVERPKQKTTSCIAAR